MYSVTILPPYRFYNSAWQHCAPVRARVVTMFSIMTTLAVVYKPCVTKDKASLIVYTQTHTCPMFPSVGQVSSTHGRRLCHKGTRDLEGY